MGIVTPTFNYTIIEPNSSNINHSEILNNIQPDNISAAYNIQIDFLKYAVGDAWPLLVYILIMTGTMVKMKHPTVVAFVSFFVSSVFAVLLPEDNWCKYAMMIISVGSFTGGIYTLIKL